MTWYRANDAQNSATIITARTTYGTQMKGVVDSVDVAVPVTATALTVEKVSAAAAVTFATTDGDRGATRPLIFCRTGSFEDAQRCTRALFRSRLFLSI